MAVKLGVGSTVYWCMCKLQLTTFQDFAADQLFLHVSWCDNHDHMKCGSLHSNINIDTLLKCQLSRA
jgi:hypothetical protein